LKIRKVETNEIINVRKQRISCYEEYKKDISNEHWKALKGTLSSENDVMDGVEFFVMEDGGKIVGSVVLFPAQLDAYEWQTGKAEYPEIRMLAVDKESRGHGIARELVKHCILVSQEKGYTHIGLHTADFMKGAMKLYEDMGFVRVPELDFEPANDGVMVRGFRLNMEK